jgi:hypothetical protein
MSIVIDIAAQFTGKRAFAQAENAADKLGRTVKHALIGVGVTAFAKSAITAFAEQEKQLNLFKNSLRTIGFEFATSDSLAFLNSLKLQYGVADTQLIPAYEQLLTTTRSLAASQNLTNVALDIAARQGISVTQAADALSKAYIGNTKSVGALGLGISKATLASGDFAALLKEITAITKGAAAAGADTFAGKLAKLKVAADTAKESIGAGLVEAIMQITRSSNIDELQQQIINFGENTAVSLGKIGKLISENIGLIKSFGVILAASFAITKVAAFISALEKVIKTVKILKNSAIAAAVAEAFMLNPAAGAAMALGIVAAVGATIEGIRIIEDRANKAAEAISSIGTGLDRLGKGGDQGGAAKYAEGAAARAAKDAKAAAKAQLQATKAQTKATQDQAKLNKAKTLFDIDQIQILAALQGKVTEEEKLRLSLQMALLEGNAGEAKRLSEQLAISQLKTTDLALAISRLPKALNPFEGWSKEIDDLIKKILEMMKLLQESNQTILAGGLRNPQTSLAGYVDYRTGERNSQPALPPLGGYDAVFNNSDVNSRGGNLGNPMTTNIYVSGATQGLLNELRNGLIDSSASGSFATINSPAG